MNHLPLESPTARLRVSVAAKLRKLVIAPHVDDEALGCASMLDEDSHVLFCGIDESLVISDPDHRIPADERERELERVAAYFGYTYEIDQGSCVNHYEINRVIKVIEGAINAFCPDVILLPYAGGYNQDHQTVFNAAQVALRPHDKNFFVKKVLIYEGIHDLIWSSSPYVANYFVPLDIERKIAGYLLHKSQVRGMRSPEMLRSHARVRGLMANCEYAEAFQIQRWVA